MNIMCAMILIHLPELDLNGCSQMCIVYYLCLVIKSICVLHIDYITHIRSAAKEQYEIIVLV